MSKSKSNRFSNMACYFCHNKSPMKQDCLKLKNKQQASQEEHVNRVTVTKN